MSPECFLPPYFQIIRGDSETGSGFGIIRYHLQRLCVSRDNMDPLGTRRYADASSLALPDSASDLIELSEAKPVRPVDDDRVRCRNIEAGSHDGCAHRTS